MYIRADCISKVITSLLMSKSDHTWQSCVLAVLPSTITDETGNQTIVTMSCVSKAMNDAMYQHLRKRALILRVHALNFSPGRITEMKSLRQDLFNDIKSAIKAVVTKADSVPGSGETFRYNLKKGGDLVGRVAVTPVRAFWLEVEVYSVGRGRFIKQWTCTYFPTIDTQGSYLAVDTGAGQVVRKKLSTCMTILKEQVTRFCVTPTA